MFSRKEQLIQRTGKNGVGRYDFLKLLITEFQTTKSKDARKQVLANLANFAYDPINNGFLRDLKAIDLFLHVLSESDEILVRFAIGGICNLCLDTINRDYILENQGISVISSLLDSADQQTVLSAITTLMYLAAPSSAKDITRSEIVDRMVSFSKSTDKRISNLANIFLTDYCTPNPKKLRRDSRKRLKKYTAVPFLFFVMRRIIIELLRSVTRFYSTTVEGSGSLSTVRKGIETGKRVTVARTVTEDDITNFAKLTDDYNPIHIEMSGRVVHGALLNGFLSGVLGTILPGPGTVVVEQLIRYPKPCYPGDAIEISVEVLSSRKIIKCRYSIVANSERTVLEGEGKFVTSNLGLKISSDR